MIILFVWRKGDIETALCSLVVFLCELKGIQGERGNSAYE